MTESNAQTVAHHYNQLQEAGLEERTKSKIFYLRNFNNWVKSVVIGDTLNKIRVSDKSKKISVLDLGSGKGGDLLKWKKGRIDSLVCADIAATSVQQSEERHRQNCQRDRRTLFDAEFIAADCTKVRLKDRYKDSSRKFDLVSCQFAFHYCFESYDQAVMMIRNACECLEVGGYFIGTTPNGNEIVRRLLNSPDYSFGNDLYSIKFNSELGKDNFPLFGTKYDFHLEGVVDCPEFLVYMPAVEKLASQFGMRMVFQESFPEFFNKKSGVEENKRLLANMQALEAYPPWEGTELSQPPSSYTEAKEFYDAIDPGQDGRPRKIGTLSVEEYEAASIYCVFVFQKVKDVSQSSD